MKKLILGLFAVSLLFFLPARPILAADIGKADELFDKGVFLSALAEYDLLAQQSKDGHEAFKAFYRSVECLTHLFRYGEAAERLRKYQGNLTGIDPYRFLTLKAVILQNFMLQYGGYQRTDIIDIPGKEVFRLSPKEVNQEISDCYLKLWESRQVLVDLPLKDESYFLDIDKVDFGMYPSYLDYVVESWLRHMNLSIIYQNSEKKNAAPDAYALLADAYDHPLNWEDGPGVAAASLIESLSRLHSDKDRETKERLEINRLMVPMVYYSYFSFPKEKNYTDYALEARKVLLRWQKEFKDPEAKAEALLFVAVKLNPALTGKLKNQFKDSHDLCQRIEREYPKSKATPLARKYRLSLEMPLLSFQAKSPNEPSDVDYTYSARNVKNIYFRIYKVDPMQIIRSNNQNNLYGYRGFSALFMSYPFPDWIKKTAENNPPFKSWQQETQDPGNFEYITRDITLPDLEQGFYLLLSSADPDFKCGRSLMSAGIVNKTDLILMTTTGVTARTLSAYYDFIEKNGPNSVDDEISRMYVVNHKTGQPVGDVELNLFNYQQNTEDLPLLKTDPQGMAGLRRPVGLPQGSYNNFQFDVMARHDQSYAFLAQPVYLNFSSQSPYEIFMETDRPIYRPGDKVQVKAIVVKHTSSGVVTVGEAKTINLTARDPNGKDIFTENAKLNDFGSATFSFEIPAGRLLGSYSIFANYTDNRFSNGSSVSIKVEEYKRPEFEISLKPADKPWKYKEPVEIEGQAKYYFGGAVSEAPVHYTIRRQDYVPFCFRAWFGRGNNFGGYGQEIASGDVKTDKDGKFTIAFTPTSTGNNGYNNWVPDISAFDVQVEGRDAGGRTIHGSNSYRAGKNAVYFTITPQKGFFFARDAVHIDASQLTLNDTPQEGRADYEVYGLASDAVAKNFYSYGTWYSYTNPVLQVQLKDVKNGPMAVSGQVDFDKDGRGNIELKDLKPGTYRLVIKAKDSWNEEAKQDQIFVVAKDNKTAVALGAISVTLPEKQEYAVGETAKFLIGSARGAGKYFLEIWTGEYLQEKKFIDSNMPVQIVEVPVSEALKGGFTLRWFGVCGHNTWYGQESVSVPWAEKKLRLDFDPYTRELLPGLDVSWGIKVLDKDQKPQNAEVLALMYDRSLEYYFSANYPWLDSLYVPKTAAESNYGYDSIRYLNVYQIPVTEGLLEKMRKDFETPDQGYRLPGLRTYRTWAGSDRGDFSNSDKFGFNGQIAEKQAMVRSESIENEPFFGVAGVGGAIKGMDRRLRQSADDIGDQLSAGLDSLSKNLNGDKKEKSNGLPMMISRKEFADTAFFQPHILTSSDGKGTIHFKVPEQLTGWTVKAFAFTKDAKEGTAVEQAVTRKDLMVRVDIPRFFREKDKGTITAFVHNEGKEPLKGRLQIDVTENSKNINEKIKLQDHVREFSVEPHSQKSFDWMVEIPPGVTTYKVRASGVSGDLTDAEERALPVLPSRERLSESRFVSISGNTSVPLAIKLKDDSTRVNESMNLQVEPQLFLTVMNAMPFLIEYPHECVEQTLNKFVPLSILNQVYLKHPEVKAAVGKIPKRSTPSPAWDKNDPNRQMTMLETPWVWESEGRPTIWPVIDLFNPDTVQAKEAENLNKLRQAQLPSGAFPWWAGGSEDPYITLYVLDGFAQARRFGKDVPHDIIERALAYVNKEIPLRLKPEAYELSLISMAAYVVTSYPQDQFPGAKQGFEAARFWVKYLEENIHALTQFGKAYLAYTYYHLGDTKRANEVLDMALDGSREDPMAGVYWTPEKYSWVWYSDTLEMHAFLLRTLQELRPQDPRIDGMVKWLLFNRKGNVWKSTKASVAAIYALVEYMDKKGALVSDENVKVQWGKLNDSVFVAADDWLDKPLTWQKRGFEIQPSDASATVSKTGPGTAFASMTWTYSTDQIPQASEPGMITLTRDFYRRVKEGEEYHLKPLVSGDSVNVGDVIEVQLKVNTRSQFEYLHLKDPKAAGFEAEALLSGWQYDALSYYEEPRDSLTNFFMSWMPHGEYVFRYRLRPTKPGTYRIGAATLQPMYAPEMTGHSAGFELNVDP